MNLSEEKMQDIIETISNLEKIMKGKRKKSKKYYIQRLDNIIQQYAPEIRRELNEEGWHSLREGGLAAGHLYCLLGKEKKGMELLSKSLQIHKDNMGEYNAPLSSVLEFIVDTLEEFGIEDRIPHYKKILETAREAEREKPEDLRKRIIHLEADMECTTGDLEQIFVRTKNEQARLYTKLGEYQNAIEHYQKANEVAIKGRSQPGIDEKYIPNMLAIVDCNLALKRKKAAKKEFKTLLEFLIPKDFKKGDSIPSKFCNYYERLLPYFVQFRMSEGRIILAAYARFEEIDQHLDEQHVNWEISHLAELLATYNASQGKFQVSSNIFDVAREVGKHLETRPHLSEITQAEYLIKAKNNKRATEILDNVANMRIDGGFDRGNPYNIASLYLHIREVDKALDIIDKSCTEYKRGLASGSYDNVLEARRIQINILKAIIGDKYYEPARKKYAGKSLKLVQGLKLLSSGTKK